MKPRKKRPVEDRFHEKYEQGEGCWEWTAHRNPKTGYGMLNVDGVPQYAHRLALILRGVEIPYGHEVHHKCENRGCVNPEHLEALPVKDHCAQHDKRWRICGAGIHDLTDPSNVYDYGGVRRCRPCALGLRNSKRREEAA
jgi:hypothetical protein